MARDCKYIASSVSSAVRHRIDRSQNLSRQKNQRLIRRRRRTIENGRSNDRVYFYCQRLLECKVQCANHQREKVRFHHRQVYSNAGINTLNDSTLEIACTYIFFKSCFHLGCFVITVCISFNSVRPRSDMFATVISYCVLCGFCAPSPHL